MEDNFLTEGTFKASMDTIIEKKFGDGYTLQDVGELVELTEMTLEDRVAFITSEIDKDFENLSKSLDNVQKSLYDMLDLLTDSQVDLGKANEKGGITDADVNKIVDGLKLEEKFFPHLYQYLDERFGLDAEKVKNFRSRTAEVLDTQVEGSPETVREGRTESTAEINRKMGDSADPKKVGRKAFEDQNVFSQKLKLYTEGHKEPSKQGGDDDKKDKKSDEESWLSKIVKIGMIAGMIMDILMKSPEIVKFFADTWNTLSDKLKEVWEDLKKSWGDGISGAFGTLWDKTIKPWMLQQFDTATEWFKTTFPEVYNTISSLYTLVEGLVFSTMSKEEQEKYAAKNPDSDLAIWRKAGGGKLDVWDLGQYRAAFSGGSGEFLRELNKENKVESYFRDRTLGADFDIENYADYISNEEYGTPLAYAYNAYKKNRFSANTFLNFLKNLDISGFTVNDNNREVADFLMKYGLTQVTRTSPGVHTYSNYKKAVENFENEIRNQKEEIKQGWDTTVAEKGSKGENLYKKYEGTKAPTSDNRIEEQFVIDQLNSSDMSTEQKATKYQTYQETQELKEQGILASAPKLNVPAGGFVMVKEVHYQPAKSSVGNPSSAFNASDDKK